MVCQASSEDNFANLAAPATTCFIDNQHDFIDMAHGASRENYLLMQCQQLHVIITTNMILLIQCVNASSGESATSNVAQKIVTRVTIANINK